MGLIDELAAPPERPTTFADWLIRQTPETRKALEVAASDTRWTTNALIVLLRKHGATCSKDSVVPWRTKHGYVAGG